MSDVAAGEPVQIHRYPNRRYYDTAQSRYVTLEDLHEMIRRGLEIRVLESETREDITAKVLAQLLLEIDPAKFNVFPTSLLHRLIRWNESAASEVAGRYVRELMSIFSNSQRSMEQGMRQMMGQVGTGGAPVLLPEWLRLAWGPLSPPSFLYGTGQGSEAASHAAAPESSAPAEASAKLPSDANANSNADLLRVIEELRQQVQSLEVRTKRPTKKKRRRR